MNTQLKFDGPQLDEVLERIGQELGPQAVIVEANRSRRGGIGGFFAREWFEVVVEAPAPPDAEDEQQATSTRRSLMSDDDLMSLADEVADQVEAHQTSEAVVESFDKVLARVGGAAVSQTRVAQAPVPSVSSQPPASPARMAGPVAERPSDQVVPTGPAPAAPAPGSLRDLDLHAMLAVLDRRAPAMPSALTSGSGAIVAVVGDLSAARPVAAAIAARAGLQEEDVLVATPSGRDGVPSWLRIDGPATAAARVERWRRQERPVVVAVDLTPGRDGHVWAADVLAAIGADEVRLVARAWQVTDELAPKAAVLGGVDGIDLVEVDAAGEPEAFLDLDIPVLGIDGRPATPELWAALLLERRNDVAV